MVIDNYIPEPNSGCWLYLGYLDKYGYGNAGGKFVHRLSYQHHKQTILNPSQLLLHSCDQPSCINPEHLRIGTHKDNAEDRIKRGRHKLHILGKSPEYVSIIRSSTKTNRVLSIELSLHKSIVSRIRNNLVW